MNFFLEKLGGPYFSSQSLLNLRILHTKFGSIWTTSWPDKIYLFLKFLFREIQKIPYEILTFFLGKLHQKFFLFYILITLVILHAEFGLIWTTPWPDKVSIFLKIELANNKRISRYSRLKHEVFSIKVRRTIFFVSESIYPGDTPYQVWFDLNNFLTR